MPRPIRSSPLLLVPVAYGTFIIVGGAANTFLDPGPLQSTILITAALATVVATIAIIIWSLATTHPRFFPLLRQGLSPRRALRFSRNRRLLTGLTLLAAPILLLTLASLARTLSIQTNDLFHFGVADRWWCDATINYAFSGASVDTFAPGVPPRAFSAPSGSGWFFHHVKAHSATWAISGGAATLVASRDLYFFGYYEYALAGTYAGRTYWLFLPAFFPLLTLLTLIPLALWLRAYARHLAVESTHLCPTCSYDLRAHTPGQRCPECGTPI